MKDDRHTYAGNGFFLKLRFFFFGFVSLLIFFWWFLFVCLFVWNGMKKNAVLVVVEEEVIRDAVLRKSQAYDR